MTPHYRHTQTGYVLIVALGATMVASLGMAIRLQGTHVPSLVTWLVPAIMAISLMLTYSMTVHVDDEALRFHLSFGWFRRRYALKEIASTRIVTNHWLYGWGIRWIGTGWLYNVSGLKAVEMTLKNGKKVRIGTDEPDRLEAAIQQALR